MLPSTSSPVEAAPTPVSPSGPYSCQAQYVGQSREGGARDEYRPPSPATLGMCGSEESGQEGRAAKPPPDLCTRDKSNPFRAQSVEDAVGGAAIAQGACDYEYALNDSHCGGEERGDTMEEGACSLPPPQSLAGAVPHCSEEDVKCTTKAGLPDLCDTGTGARSRINYKASGRSASPGEDVQCESPCKGGAARSRGSESVSQGFGSSENTQKLERERVNESHCESDDTKCSSESKSDNAQGGVLEAESGMEEEAAVTEDSGDGSGIPVKPEERHEQRNTENTEGSVCGGGDIEARGESSEVCEDDSVDMKDIHDTEMMAGPLESYLIHDNQQISLVACGITQCDPSFQYDMAMAEPLETEDGMSLIKYNLHHSSHPMYEKWPCYFYITEEHLPSFTIDSHGRHIGSVRQHPCLCSLS